MVWCGLALRLGDSGLVLRCGAPVWCSGLVIAVWWERFGGSDLVGSGLVAPVWCSGLVVAVWCSGLVAAVWWERGGSDL